MTTSSGQRSELDRLRDTIEITNTLLTAISSTEPVHTLASRIGVLCHGTAIIYDVDGKIVASTGVAPAQLIWNEIAATNQSDLALEIGRWHVLSRRVALRDGIHVIAIASRGLETLEQLGELILDTSERLLGAVHGIQYGAIRRDRRDNEQLIASLHDGILPSREHRFWSRMTQFDFPAYAPVRSVELAPFDGESARESQVTQLVSQARSTATPLLIMLHRADREAPATIAALVPDSASGEAWLQAVSRRYLVGASGPFDSLGRVPEGVREAETALDIGKQWAAAARDPAVIGPIWTDRIDLATWLLSHVDPKQLKTRIAATLAPLRDPGLRETLVTYLASDQHIGRTADALFVHPNTVRYRLGKVEEAMGMPITSAPALANLVLSLRPEIAATQLRAIRGSDTDPN
ncbi:PucR family transcriptional regulator [Leucobacter sp. W1153]|uniref:PucR family transcriptional regulator n=1 Tax=Leucobacter sp. W1153 TaxID=3439064 RepID=UPI003F30D19C